MSAPWKFSPDVIRKARAYVKDNRVAIDPGHEGIYWVTGTRLGSAYRVQTDADHETGKITYITCTCPHGLNIGAGTAKCSHAVAVLLTIKAEREWAARAAAGDPD